jgi:CDP-glucose 4,6-dehydratase
MADTSWKGLPVLLTGNTGFKGGWLSLWLHALGAEVHGYATAPPTKPSLFEVGRVSTVLASDTRADLADLDTLRSVFEACRPAVVFHLAAQPLVRASFVDPLGTLATNVIGTAHVLEAARAASSVRAIVVVTTDKVYRPRSPSVAHGEDDSLGGDDVYSASKAAAELVASSYRASFFARARRSRCAIATVRAGNVIGGGDWALDRLVPDCLRAFASGEAVHLRYPDAVRPWQHVLEPLAGYLELAQRLLDANAAGFETAWNFGPDVADVVSVREMAEALAALWRDGARVVANTSTLDPPETSVLMLDSTRARQQLRWAPRWRLADALKRTVEWHRAWHEGEDMQAVTLRQIADYSSASPRS